MLFYGKNQEKYLKIFKAFQFKQKNLEKQKITGL